MITLRASEITVIDHADDIKVPSSIWSHIVTDKRPNLVFSSIKVILTEKTKGVLSQPQVKIQFPRGGGEVDLSKYVTDKQGTFFVQFELEEEVSNEFFYLFFVSQNKKRKLENQIYGSGCKNYYDIKKYFLDVNGKNGIEVNTTRNRHLSVLGGNFIFASVVGKDIKLTQVTFSDSNNSEYFCERSQRESN